METQTEILGYVLCRTCLTPKSIKQGKGKRAAFVHGRCECGPDMRTGKAAQLEMKAFKPLEQVQSEMEKMNHPEPEPKPEPKTEVKQTESVTESQTESKPNPQPESEPESKPISTAACVGIGAVFGLFFGGVIKAMKVVA